VRIALADDAVLFRTGVANLLREAGFDIVGEARDATDLLTLVRSRHPDVVIVDIRMPPTHTLEGLQAAKTIRADHPGVGILVLSQYIEPQYALDLIEGAEQRAGYLLKDRVGDVRELVEAIRQVAAGRLVVDPSIVAQLVTRSRRRNPLDALSQRELEVLGLMAEGRSNQAIATRLFITDKTVEAHVRAIFTKLTLPAASDDHRRVLAVLAYLMRDQQD
jgi:DNA-binding NarL/FixJ family response regulator